MDKKIGPSGVGRRDSAILHRPRVENVADWYFYELLCTVVSCQSKDFSTEQLGKTWHPSTFIHSVMLSLSDHPLSYFELQAPNTYS
jgi:hypothetical protein